MKRLRSYFIDVLFVLLYLSMASLVIEANEEEARVQYTAEQISEVFDEIKMRSDQGIRSMWANDRRTSNKNNVPRKLKGSKGSKSGSSKGSKSSSTDAKDDDSSCGKHNLHFAHVTFDPFPGTGSAFFPPVGGFGLSPGATVALYEQPLLGTAIYYGGGDKKKKFNVYGQLTGTCMVVAQHPTEAMFKSHCNMCLTYYDDCTLNEVRRNKWKKKQRNCKHPALGSVTATGELYSHWDFNDSNNPLEFILLASEAFLSVTGASFDLRDAVDGGILSFVHDGAWNMELKVPLSGEEIACKLQDVAYDEYFLGGKDGF